MTPENDAKFEEELTCHFKIDEKFDEFWPEYSKISKICTFLNGLLLTKVYIIFELKKYRGVMFDGTEYWHKIWRKTDFCF